MVSQVVELDGVAEFDSYIRGYNAYKDIWSPVVGEILLLKREPDNLVDASAVAVWKEENCWPRALQYCLCHLTVLETRLQQRFCPGDWKQSE